MIIFLSLIFGEREEFANVKGEKARNQNLLLHDAARFYFAVDCTAYHNSFDF